MIDTTKIVALAAAGMLVATAFAWSQTNPPATALAAPPAPLADPRAQPIVDTQLPGQIPAASLIGRKIVNAQNEALGEVKSVILGSAGAVDAVIVGIGGFLGVGEREVAIGWKDVAVTHNGQRVTVNMSKEQLMALPPYRHAAATRVPAGKPVEEAAASKGGTAPRPGRPEVTPARGYLMARSLIGTAVYNLQNETVGSIKDLVLRTDGEVQGVILGTGGVLGIGEHDVGLSWQQLQLQPTGDQARLVVNLTRDQLKAMPEYWTDSSIWVAR